MVHPRWAPSTSSRSAQIENPGSFEENPAGSAAMTLNPLKGSAEAILTHAAALARNHSAPSATFSALLKSDYYPTSDSADIEFFTHGEFVDFSGYDGRPLLKQNIKDDCIKDEQPPMQLYSTQSNLQLNRNTGRMPPSPQDHVSQQALSCIPEHGGEDSISTQTYQRNPPISSSHKPLTNSDSQLKGNLIRHSSLPAECLLAKDDTSERPSFCQQTSSHNQVKSQHVSSHIQALSPRTQQLGSHMQTTSPRTQQLVSQMQMPSSRTHDSTVGKVFLLTSKDSPRGVPTRPCYREQLGPGRKEEYGSTEAGLFRHSSFPTGLLSQLTLDELSNGVDKGASSSNRSLVHSVWDEAVIDPAMQKIPMFAHRKRVREGDAKFQKEFQAADVMIGTLDPISISHSNQYTISGSPNGDTMVMNDSVLCKSRAKRGCATHPRSIAERNRRTKISERIKKLQDLVPNLDKQAHIADMLDDVVEYVKHLQQKVEELSKHNKECNGSCQEKRENSSDT
ncbi:hypothetical protein KP509_16G038400 [Ceratopteris richardii]|uniref:BHLH domain-containing protein n=1 Tax=Ceratopteris richardii TaxID=49495 RepID=A0A8T2SY47_CERRI|nr:hypothetical protein KP509_16G038400 [Ceratopteris richardii]KAH7387731.1 hypothetical protein KP509_16G038400 [Ceratopteris richardii]KAH7387732.1 hypothetical protein KP509_16G038400 [Ceratopteris richardii]